MVAVIKATAKPLVVVMGVTGSGKSLIGTRLAARLLVPFVDGDDLHPQRNIKKMSAGHPLNDDDRWPWLDKVGGTLRAASDQGLVIACSALKRAYRDVILAVAPDVEFLMLRVPRAVLEQRLHDRRRHFMPAALLDSQFADLEPLSVDEPGFVIDATGKTAAIVTHALCCMGIRSCPLKWKGQNQ